MDANAETFPKVPRQSNCPSPAVLDGQTLYQRKPKESSGTHEIYGNKRSYTDSLQSYERAARKEFVILMRNLRHTWEYPDYHIVVTFQKQMSIREFSEKRNKAHDHLKDWGVRGYFTHEPTVSRDGVHLHMLAIYERSEEDLRLCIQLAWEYEGLKYNTDFQVKVLPLEPSISDCERIFSYLLKYNGGRETNLRKPVLFNKGLGLRKTGSFGKWFAKSKKLYWEEHCEEMRLRHEHPGETDADCQLQDSATDLYTEEAEPQKENPREFVAAAFRAVRKRIQERRRYARMLAGYEYVRPLRSRSKPKRVEGHAERLANTKPRKSVKGNSAKPATSTREYLEQCEKNLRPVMEPIPGDVFADIIWSIFKREPGKNTLTYVSLLRSMRVLGVPGGSVATFLNTHGFEVRTIAGVEQIVNVIPDPIERRAPGHSSVPLSCYFCNRNILAK